MIKHIPLVSLFSILFNFSAVSQCTETNQEKVLLVGDSWAFFMGVDQTINTVFDRWGHSNFEYYTNATLSENGAETVDFMQADKQDEIQAQLDARPDIDVVHLSLGGNDVLGDWHVDFTPFQTDSLIDTVLTRLLTIVDFIKEARPGIRIFWSGYAYPNFGQVLHDAGIFQTVHPFYDTWEGMGFPTFQQLNDILNEVSNIVEAYAAFDPQVDFVNATGLMQYTYGQDQELSVPPGGSYPPFAVTLPEGFSEYPSPKASMRDYGLFLDCFHLSAGGYRDLISYHTQKFYHKFLMGDQYFLAEEGVGEGSVSSQGNISPGELKMGVFESEEFRPVLTFNTSTLPNAGVESASLFLRRETLSGTNPVGEGLQVKISNGAIGETIAIEIEDFDTETDAIDTPCIFGLSNGNGRWIRIELPESFLPLIDNTSSVQFMLAAPEGADGLITFTNAADPEFAPVLNVVHQVITEVVQVESAIYPEVLVFPNPAKERVYFKSEGHLIESVVLYNQHGQQIHSASGNDQLVHMNLNNLPSGVYIARIFTQHGVVARRLMIE